MKPTHPLLFLLLSTLSVSAQFTPELLQNNSYWADGKAEFNLYAAEMMREGAARPCEVIHILMREPFDPKQLVKADGPQRPEHIAVLKMNQILSIPTGLYLCQQMHSNFWRVDNAQLLKFSLTSSDGFGNSYKEARREGDHLTYEYRTYRDGMAGGQETAALPANACFYDELPWLVRTLDFRKPEGEIDLQLADTVINQKKDNLEFAPAKVSFNTTGKTLEVKVRHARGEDRFTIDRDRLTFCANGKWPMAAT